jgi:hypothetical protein
MDVQVVLVRSAGHAEKKDPKPEDRIVSLLVQKNIDLCHSYACCQHTTTIYLGVWTA